MKKKIAIQGFEGSFHHLAAQHYFNNDAIELITCGNFRDVVHAVCDDEECAAGVMAIENSIAGSILPNYNLIANSGLSIPGEIYLQIDQNLLVNPGVGLNEIREVHSHPMALLQCTDYLEQFPWKLVETEDTALSAREISESGSRHVAAIAGAFAAELFDLDVIAKNIHTARNNYTRFWIIQKESDTAIDANKASMVFQTDHSIGSLARVLGKITECGVNLSKIQSLPIPDSDWKYAFHTDCEFADLEQWNRVLTSIRPFTAEIKVYGVYKNGKTFLQ